MDYNKIAITEEEKDTIYSILHKKNKYIERLLKFLFWPKDSHSELKHDIEYLNFNQFNVILTILDPDYKTNRILNGIKTFENREDAWKKLEIVNNVFYHNDYNILKEIHDKYVNKSIKYFNKTKDWLDKHNIKNKFCDKNKTVEFFVLNINIMFIFHYEYIQIKLSNIITGDDNIDIHDKQDIYRCIRKYIPCAIVKIGKLNYDIKLESDIDELLTNLNNLV